MPPGRPTKYDAKFCDAVIKYCGTGKSLTAFAGSILVSRDTITEWAKVHPEFSVAINIAKAVACGAWEDRSISQGDGEKGNPALTIFALKNFGPDDWKPDQPQDNDDRDLNITIRRLG